MVIYQSYKSNPLFNISILDKHAIGILETTSAGMYHSSIKCSCKLTIPVYTLVGRGPLPNRCIRVYSPRSRLRR